MPQVKVFATRETINTYRPAISAGIHAALVEALGIPPGKPFQHFVALEPENSVLPPDRSPQYLLIEISLFSGRSTAAKKNLIRSLYRELTARTDITPANIEVILYEAPPENWGIKGRPGDEVELSYRVDI
ncbi:MAG: tautomerase family protein [Bacillota bacterium]|nr:MAG: tautomerase family protein [Bacillota bacterium]